MTQNFIQPKGSLNTQVDVSGLQNQLAQMFAKQQLQGQADNNQDALRQTVNEIVKSKLLNTVETPQYTTIQDIFNAPKGSRLNSFAEFLQNPETVRTIGNLLPSYGYNPNTGKVENSQEDYAQRLEKDMFRKQSQALMEQKEQNDLAQAMANAYNQRDIAEENNKRMRELQEQELEWRKEQNALDRGLKREQMAMQERLSRIIHGGGGSGSVTGGAAGVGGVNLNDIKMTAAERKALTENKTTLANIESGLQALEKNPDAYQWYKGVLGADIANRIDPKGVGTRTQIDNITAVYRKWLTGAQMSDKERKAYERFLPAPTDNYNIVKAKLNGMKGAIERSNDAILSNYGINNTGKKDSLGLGL